jgi:hypothetical protein
LLLIRFRMFTDSHCHLSFPELREQLPVILDAMAQAQVERALCICTTLEEFEDVYRLAHDHPHLWATVGVHPDTEGLQEPSLDDLLTRAARPRVVGIGETGLDYYRLGERSVADMAWQRERYRTHIRAGRLTRWRSCGKRGGWALPRPQPAQMELSPGACSIASRKPWPLHAQRWTWVSTYRFPAS